MVSFNLFRRCALFHSLNTDEIAVEFHSYHHEFIATFARRDRKPARLI